MTILWSYHLTHLFTYLHDGHFPFFFYYQYKDGNNKGLQLAASKNLNLNGLCEISDKLGFFCELFNLESSAPSISIMAHVYANNAGFGLRLAFEAELEFMADFDFVEDLIGWPDDNKVSASLGVTFTNNMFKVCVGFIDSEFCQCENDTNCDDDKVCDNTFKVSSGVSHHDMLFFLVLITWHFPFSFDLLGLSQEET